MSIRGSLFVVVSQVVWPVLGTDKGISPRWGFTFWWATELRANAPWAIESRPLGGLTGDFVAEKRPGSSFWLAILVVLYSISFSIMV